MTVCVSGRVRVNTIWSGKETAGESERGREREKERERKREREREREEERKGWRG